MRAKRVSICALCHRELKPGAHVVAHVGPVGPECYRKVAAVEHYLKPVLELDSRHPRFNEAKLSLEALGFKVRRVVAGSYDHPIYGPTALFRLRVEGWSKRFPEAVYRQRRALVSMAQAA